VKSGKDSVLIKYVYNVVNEHFAATYTREFLWKAAKRTGRTSNGSE